jgi:hypothetical protein
MSDDEQFYVCIPTTQQSAVPSVSRFCRRCHQTVWVDSEAIHLAESMVILCADCALAVAVEEGDVEVGVINARDALDALDEHSDDLREGGFPRKVPR